MKKTLHVPPPSGQEPGNLSRPVKGLKKTSPPGSSAGGVSQDGNDAYRSLLEKAPLGITLFKRDGTYLYVNPAFEKMFGYSLSEIPNGRVWFRKAYPNKKDRARAVATWKQFFEKNDPAISHPFIFRVRCGDGTSKDVHFFRQVIVEEDRVLVFCADVTDRQQTMEDLRRSRQR
jgi:PAS domain S-box-containing protein